MKVLLDTNALLRWTRGEQVPRKVERIICSPQSNLLVSIVTRWEIALKQAPLAGEKPESRSDLRSYRAPESQALAHSPEPCRGALHASAAPC
jgi:PIN domain nuclease of toxin-antitoxin system